MTPLITYEDFPMGLTVARLGIHKCGEIVPFGDEVVKVAFWCSFRREGAGFRFARDRDEAKRKIESLMLEWLRGADPDWFAYRAASAAA